jgi:hypothetical protein
MNTKTQMVMTHRTDAASAPAPKALTHTGFAPTATVTKLRPRGVVMYTRERKVDSVEVVELIEAAGPLTLQDIAGGLDVSLGQASVVVQTMLDRNCLKQDEWERHRIWGECRDF